MESKNLIWKPRLKRLETWTFLGEKNGLYVYKTTLLLVNFWDHISNKFSLNIFFCFRFYTPKCLRPHYQHSFFLNNLVCFFTLKSRMSRTLCIWCHKLCNAKTGVGPTFTWSNEAWSRGIPILALCSWTRSLQSTGEGGFQTWTDTEWKVTPSSTSS